MYKRVDEATRDAAFLADDAHFDVAILCRVNANEIPDAEYKNHCLSDEDWQKCINLVDAAPRMLGILKRISNGEEVSKEEINTVLQDVEATF